MNGINGGGMNGGMNEQRSARGRSRRRAVRSLAMLTPLLVVLLGAVRTGRADEPVALPAALPDSFGPERVAHFADRRVQLEALLGAGTTVGLLGAALDYNVGDALALGAGAGLGAFGPLWEAHARFRPLVWRAGSAQQTLHALTLETAFSRGPYADFPDLTGSLICEGDSNRVGDHCFHANNQPRVTSFAQVELGWERRSQQGYIVRFSGGWASALHMGSPHCESATGEAVPCGGPEPARTIVVLTCALGYAF